MPENNNNGVLEAVHELATHVDKRFDAVEERFEKVDERLNKVESVVGNMRDDLISMVDKRVLRAQDEITKAIGKQIQETESRLQKALTGTRDEVVKEIKIDRERHKLFNLKVLSIFERSKIAQPEEVVAMRELVM